MPPLPTFSQFSGPQHICRLPTGWRGSSHNRSMVRQSWGAEMPLVYGKSRGSTGSSKVKNEVWTSTASEAPKLRGVRGAEEPLKYPALVGSTRSAKPKSEDVTLTDAEARRLLGVCIELIDLCSKLTRKIHPAVGTLIAYARDEAMVEAFEISYPMFQVSKAAVFKARSTEREH